MNNGFFETLSSAVQGAMDAAESARAVLGNADVAREEMEREPINYNTHRGWDFAIVELKGRKTRKYFHVVICRLDCGRYELVTYVL
jgi:hypothetical protein